MKGVCKFTNSIGVVTHVRVKNDDGEESTMTVEEYTDQDIEPHVMGLSVCPESEASNA